MTELENAATSILALTLTLSAHAFHEVIFKKLTYIFIFKLLCGASKGFLNFFKALIKPFETPQRSVKIKI